MSMQKTIRILAIAAVVQLGLAIGTIAGSGRLATAPRGDTLLSFDATQVNVLEVSDAHGAKVRLTRQRDTWRLANGFPADSERITQLIERLHSLKHGLAAATSPAARSRFNVAEKNFERHVLLQHGNRILAGLYLGRGAGARRSYVRTEHGTAVYSVPLGSYDLPVQAAAWEDKTVLQVRDVTALESGHIRIQRKNAAAKTWSSNRKAKGKQPDTEAIRRAVSLLEGLRYLKSLGKEAPDGYDFSHPALTFHIRWKQGERTYRFARHKTDDLYALKVSDRPEYFEIAGYVFDGLKADMNPEKWFKNTRATQAKKQGDKTQNTRK